MEVESRERGRELVDEMVIAFRLLMGGLEVSLLNGWHLLLSCSLPISPPPSLPSSLSLSSSLSLTLVLCPYTLNYLVRVSVCVCVCVCVCVSVWCLFAFWRDYILSFLQSVSLSLSLSLSLCTFVSFLFI